MHNPLLVKFKLPTLRVRRSFPLTALLFLITLEVALMGSGRMLQIGPVTVRMLLYLLAIGCTFGVYLLRRKMAVSTFLLLGFFTASLLISVLIGLLNGAHVEAIAEDVKPLVYVFLLPFFELAINSYSRLRIFVLTTKFAALAMAFAYLAVLAAVLTGYLDFTAISEFSIRFSEQEVSFRGTSGIFFYKGFLYLCAGLIFFAFGKSLRNKLIAVFLLTAVLASGTRGFMLSLAIVFVLYLLTRHRVAGCILAMVVTVAGFAANPAYMSSSADRETSNSIRVETIHEVADEMNPGSLLVGHGFGVGVPERPVHMEISYLEILHKQGIIGLAWWMCLLGMLLYRFRLSGYSHEAAPFLLAGLFVFVESFTNPFINNPIGLSLLFACMAGMRVVASRRCIALSGCR